MRHISQTKEALPWRFEIQVRKKRFVRKFKTRKEAENFARKFESNLAEKGADSFIFDLAAKAEYEEAKSLCNGNNLIEVARFWIEHKKHIARDAPPLRDAIAEFLESVKQTRSLVHYKHLRGSLRYFEEFHRKNNGGSIGNISALDLAKFTESIPLSAKSVRGIYGDVQNFLGWCKDVKMWILMVPRVSGRALPRIEKSPVAIWSVSEAESAIRHICAHESAYAPYYILCLFAGLRNAEAARMRWEWIDFDKKTIKVPAEICKTRDDWILLPAFLPNTVFEWLKPFRKTEGKIKHPATTAVLRIHKQCKWSNNVMRHTFATMHVAYYCDEGKTILATRHTNIATLRAHYRGVNQTHEDAARFFNLLPATLSAIPETV